MYKRQARHHADFMHQHRGAELRSRVMHTFRVRVVCEPLLAGGKSCDGATVNIVMVPGLLAAHQNRTPPHQV